VIRSTVRLLLAVAPVMLTSAALAAPARATVSINSFTLTPSTTQAGATPDITLDSTFSSADGDSPSNITVALPAGLLANPTAPTVCSTAEYETQNCPSSSEIGNGTITGYAPAFGTSLTLPIYAYLIAPQGGALGEVGIIADFFGIPIESFSAPIELRTSPSVGADITLSALPHQLDGLAIELRAVKLTLLGTVDGLPFTRNPTSCAPAATTLTLESYGEPTTPVSDSSTFTPTNCASLAYSPRIGASATIDSSDTGVAFAATITQTASDAATSGVTIELPSGLAPNLAAIGVACTASDLTACPSIGTATITTPLLAAPVIGRIVLVANSGALPSIDAVLPSPLGLTLQGTAGLGATGLTATFHGIPDAPFTSLSVSFAGGPHSLLKASSGLCASPQMVTGVFTAQSGATATVTSTVAVTGTCPSTSTGAGTGSGTGTGTGTRTGPGSVKPGTGIKVARRPTAVVRASGLTGGSPALSVQVTAGENAPELRRVAIMLPSLISIDHKNFRHGVTITLDGKPRSVRNAIPTRPVVVTLGRGGRSARITFGPPTLRLAARMLSKLHHGTKVRLPFTVVVRDTSGKQTTLHVTITVT
jgi:hypothetical protein